MIILFKCWFANYMIFNSYRIRKKFLFCILLFFILLFGSNVKSHSQLDSAIIRTETGLSRVQVSSNQYQIPQNAYYTIFKNGNQPIFKESVFVTEEGEIQRIRGLVLPELYIGREDNSLNQIGFEVKIDTTQPLVYDKERDRYSGSFDIILVENTGQDLVKRLLKDPVSIEIKSGTGRTLIDPKLCIIDHVNLPSTTIMVTDTSSKTKVPIRVKTDFNVTGYLVNLQLEPNLKILTPSRSIQGYGVQAIPITTIMQGYDKKNSIKVSFVTNKGSIYPDNANISIDSSRTVTLRSEGKGLATLTATASSVLSDQKQFIFVFPWRFIIFSLIGGLLGSLLWKLLFHKEEKFLVAIIVGVIGGFLGALVGYVLGIKILSIETREFNEFGVLAISIACAALLDKFLDMLSQRFPSVSSSINVKR